MIIHREVTNAKEDYSDYNYTLNGHRVWVGKNNCSVSVDTKVYITYSSKIATGMNIQDDVYKLAVAIYKDKPDLTVNGNDEHVLKFLKDTECIFNL